MCLNDLGRLIAEEWQKSFDICSDFDLHHWVIMPNHIHGIVGATEHHDTSTVQCSTPRASTTVRSHSLSQWITHFKEIATQRIKPLRKRSHQPLWQQEVDQQIIPHRFAFHTFRQYITTNPHAWDWDKLHPDSPAFS